MFSPWTRLSSGSRTWRPGTAQPPNCNGKGEPPNTGSLEIIYWGFSKLLHNNFPQSSSSAIPWRQKNIGPGAPRGRTWWREGNGGAASSVAPGGGELDRHLSIGVIFGLYFQVIDINVISIVTLDKGLPVSCSSCFEVDTRRACKENILAICHICRSCANFQKHILHFDCSYTQQEGKHRCLHI